MVSLLKLVLMTLSQIQTGEVSGGGEGGELSSQSLKKLSNHQTKMSTQSPKEGVGWSTIWEKSKIFL